MSENTKLNACAIYKSARKNETYLYIKRKDKFDDVPESLLGLLGTLEWVMDINLEEQDKLARANIKQVCEEVKQKGFFLQMPPSDPVLKTTETH